MSCRPLVSLARCEHAERALHHPSFSKWTLQASLASSSSPETSNGLTRFYQDVAGLERVSGDGTHSVLESATFQLVVHAIRGESTPAVPPEPREDSYIKPFFPVPSLAEARARAATLGGMLRPVSAEWEARGFRACDGVDPDGNVIQCRESLP